MCYNPGAMKTALHAALAFSLMSAVAFAAVAPISAVASPVKVMTYNIRYSAGDEDSPDNN